MKIWHVLIFAIAKIPPLLEKLCIHSNPTESGFGGMDADMEARLIPNSPFSLNLACFQ